jgi:hypothetical protein
MKISQYKRENKQWIATKASTQQAHLCLLFGSRLDLDNDTTYYSDLHKLFPDAQIVTCSTAGNILNEQLLDNTIIATCIEFSSTVARCHLFDIQDANELALGQQVATYFDAPDLANILLFSCTGINAGKILSGINTVLKGRVPVSGGVAGDDTRFERTLIGLNDTVGTHYLVGIGMYGEHLKVSHGSKGGWENFGPQRTVTKAKDNVLFELDNKPVLDLYKEYLGPKAHELPGSALLFPFAIIDPETNEQIVRGVQNTDEANKSLILYGDIQEGDTIQLMRSDFEKLIEGAGESARETMLLDHHQPQLAILVSCVARRLVLGQLTEEELAETKKILGESTPICGFYSYSELSPLVGDNACHLHNQTMTITSLTEI